MVEHVHDIDDCTDHEKESEIKKRVNTPGQYMFKDLNGNTRLDAKKTVLREFKVSNKETNSMQIEFFLVCLTSILSMSTTIFWTLMPYLYS